MGLTRLLGVGDLLAAIILLLVGGVPAGLARGFAFYLIAKGGIFAVMGDKISILDILCGCYLLAAAYGFSVTLISVIAALFLVQKAVFSFF